MNGRRQIFANIPPATKGLLIINIAMFIVTFLAESSGYFLTGKLAIFFFKSDFFEPYQIVTHMFMHGGFAHIFFNMYALWLFGQIIESRWGTKRFLIYYFVTGIGAVILHQFVTYLDYQSLVVGVSPEGLDLFNSTDIQKAQAIMMTPTVGASGAVFGVLLAFGMLFPNVELRLLFIPVPIKAKYFVIGYAVIELFLGVGDFQWDNIAHYAHLGGMLFGLIFILIWGKDSSSGGNFYRQY
jgi:membrane associated rhomboid family serine protease